MSPQRQQDRTGSSVALIACDVFQPEIEVLRKDTPIARVDYLEMNLHDQPAVLAGTLQEKVDNCENDPAVDTILLSYGLCGNGAVGVGPKKRCTLVIPRAHDCITLFLGSKERYRDVVGEHPGTYFYSPGWIRGRRVPGPDREKWLRELYADKYDEEDMDDLIEADRESYAHTDRACYVDLTGDTQAEDYCRNCAKWLGWEFVRLPGDPALLRQLLTGPWPEDRFLTLRPGEHIELDPGPDIIRAGTGDTSE